jgi:hypothetical protein
MTIHRGYYNSKMSYDTSIKKQKTSEADNEALSVNTFASRHISFIEPLALIRIQKLLPGY